MDAFLANSLLGLQGAGSPWTLLAVTALVVFPTEITGNTAVTGALLPVPAATATALDQPATPIARGPVPGRARRTT